MISVWEDQTSPAIPRVSYDQHHAASLACWHLIERGYKRIGFIGRTSYTRALNIPHKYLAYTCVLQEAGLDIRTRDVRHVDGVPGEAYAATSDIIRTGSVPEAFFAETDYRAMEVIHALNNAGLNVSEDVGVTTYDDYPEGAAFSPSLTTVSVPRREIGRRAALMIQDWPEDGTIPESVMLYATLAVRESSIKTGTRASDTGAAT